MQIAFLLPELLQVLLFPDLLQVTVAESILATAIDFPSARRPLLLPSAMLEQHILPSVEEDLDDHNGIGSNLSVHRTFPTVATLSFILVSPTIMS